MLNSVTSLTLKKKKKKDLNLCHHHQTWQRNATVGHSSSVYQGVGYLGLKCAL